VHYNFVSLGDMQEAVKRGDFVEHATVHTNMYGTSVQAVEQVSVTVTVLCIRHITLVTDLLTICFTIAFESSSRQ
jgi:guanylate kinase